MIVQCIGDNIFNNKVQKGKVYKAIECGQDEYYIYRLEGSKLDLIDIFPKQDFKIIKAKTLLDVMKETDRNQIFLVIGIKDKILVRKRNKSLQSKNVNLNTTWKNIPMSSEWFKYVYQVYNTPVTFKEAVKSHKKFKLSSWSYFFDIKGVLGKLVTYEDKTVDELINSKSWIIEY